MEKKFGSFLCLILIVVLVSNPSPAWSQNATSPPPPLSPSIPGLVGVQYNPGIPNIPEPMYVVKMLVKAKTPRVRLINPTVETVSAFVGSGIDLNLSIEDLDLFRRLATDSKTAFLWVSETVAPYVDLVPISSISVGYQILTDHSQLSPLLSTAVKNVHYACRNLTLKGISVSTAHSFDVMDRGRIFPPSSAAFNSTYLPYMKDLLEFQASVYGAFQVDLFPFHIYRRKLIKGVTMSFVMFEAREDQYLTDSNTTRRYHNLYDIMMDGVIGALASLGHPTMPVLVIGTGWPSSGDRKEVPEANFLYAAEYNERIVVRLNMFTGTPLRRKVTPVTYIYGLYDEQKNGDPSSFDNNWGLVISKTSQWKYQINFQPQRQQQTSRGVRMTEESKVFRLAGGLGWVTVMIIRILWWL